MSVMVAHLFLLPIDGCSINPTRSFGPSLVAAWAHIPGTYYHQQAMFWFAPMFGSTLAAIAYGESLSLSLSLSLYLCSFSVHFLPL
jgi:glycerol uptake facilitator-like aquaporin